MKTFATARRIAAVWLIGAIFLPWSAQAQQACQSHGLPDSDCDGLPDVWETQVFHTNPLDKDTDHDGYDDLTEIEHGFNPDGTGKFVSGDYDHDGLDDRMELLFNTDPTNPDTDGDGHADGTEVTAGFSPSSTSTVPLPKSIKVHLSTQTLDQMLGGVTLASYKVSTGRKGYPTPTGDFKVLNKNPRAWSNHAKLWMPWWMEFSTKGLGIHELPEWPDGRKEGEDHLGTPASGGCVRLGVGPAKKMYDWTPVATPVKIVR